jgi:hypothetical protein
MGIWRVELCNRLCTFRSSLRITLSDVQLYSSQLPCDIPYEVRRALRSYSGSTTVLRTEQYVYPIRSVCCISACALNGFVVYSTATVPIQQSVRQTAAYKGGHLLYNTSRQAEVRQRIVTSLRRWAHDEADDRALHALQRSRDGCCRSLVLDSNKFDLHVHQPILV